MALRFKTTDITFTNVQGGPEHKASKPVGFEEDIRDFQTAIRGFTLNFREGDHHIDEVKVATTGTKQSDDIVNVEATVRYFDKDKADDFSATVNVLVIADVEFER